MEKSQKDNDFKSKHPGAENYPDMTTRFEKAKAAAGQKSAVATLQRMGRSRDELTSTLHVK